MRASGSIVLLMLLGCQDRQQPTPDPIGEQFWLTAGSFTLSLAMYRDGDRIELREDDSSRALGTLTPAGLSAWDDAVVNIDPSVVANLPRCAINDGADTCLELDVEGEALEFCYCASPTPPEVAGFDPYFTGLAQALLDCESTEHLDVDPCE